MGVPMAEKKCRYCAMTIPKEAKVCPHCRKRQGWTLPTKIFMGFLILVALSIFFGKPDHQITQKPSATQISLFSPCFKGSF